MLKGNSITALTLLCFVLTAESSFAGDCASKLGTGSSASDIIGCLKEKEAEIAELKREKAYESRVPADAVIAFDRRGKCPKGWVEFEDARGRMILGANGNGTHGYIRRPFRGVGGREEHTLTNTDMPLHNHKSKDFDGIMTSIGVGQIPSNILVDRSASGRANLDRRGILADAGVEHPTPISLMPPYIALYFCKKQGA